MLLFLEGEATNTIGEFVNSVIGGITSNITLSQVATVLVAIIGAGIGAMFAWKLARKGFAFIKNALSGKAGKI